MKNTLKIIDELKELLDEKSVYSEAEQLHPFMVDHLTPQAVVFPKNTQLQIKNRR